MVQVRALFGAAVLLMASSAFALDKQGSAHGGDVAGQDSGFDLSGSASLGVSIANSSYAARPDNTGLTLFRYALHADVDLIGRRLSVPVDFNVFTDRLRSGGNKLVPTELDVITGVTTTWPVEKGALELGARVEHDGQVGPTQASEASEVSLATCGNGGLCAQNYVDLRARYLYSLAAVDPALGTALADGDISGWLTLGYFAVNPTYAARPDNSGSALFRYAAHSELSVFRDLVSLGIDATFFTDRKAAPLTPSELDLTPELIFHKAPYEVHFAYERDMPLNRNEPDESQLPERARGLTQSFLYGLFVYSFDLREPQIEPMEERGQVESP
jgi:hypothetical protein